MMKKTLTTSEFAEAIGVSERIVRDLLKRNIVERSGRRPGAGLPYPEAVQKYCAHLREMAAGRGGKAAAGVATERAGLLRAQRERVERANAQEAGKVVDGAEMQAALVTTFFYLRGALMGLPKRLTGVDRRVMGEVERGVRETLHDLAHAKPFDGVALPHDEPGPPGAGAPG